MTLDAEHQVAERAGTLNTILDRGWAELAAFGMHPTGNGTAADYFEAVRRVESTVRQSLPSSAASIAHHLEYLARKRGLADDSMLSITAHPDDIMTREAVANIAAELGNLPDSAKLDYASGQLARDARDAGVPPRLLALIQAAEQRLQGWCTRAKSLSISRLILEERPQLCVEIGVYGGRSLIPCAGALAENGSGRVYGIECWDPAEAVRHATDEGNDVWWTRVDFASIKRNFCCFVADQALTAQICIIEAPSRLAATIFESIDFLHIDGSHAVIGAAEDVLLYATKVRPGGIIVFDDANWETTLTAQQLLSALGDAMMTPEQVHAENYAVFRRH